MKISKRGEYALRALIDLGIASELGWPMLQMTELASKEKLPIKFLEQIFTQLKTGGYVESRRGKFGGYSLAQPMNRIKFGEVIRMIDGPTGAYSLRQPNILRPLLLPRRKSLRAANPDVRCPEYDQHDPGSLYSRRYRRDHSSEISARQNHAAFPEAINPARIHLFQGGQADNS
jgi:Rrf2 family protein